MQDLLLDATVTEDEDNMDQAIAPISFTWSCQLVGSADPCGLGSIALNVGLLAIPAGTLAAGESYEFTVTASQTYLAATLTDTASMVVTVAAESLPEVAITASTTAKKINPSARVLLSASATNCGGSCTYLWAATGGDLELDGDNWGDIFPTDRTSDSLVIPAGTLSAGTVYTFELTATGEAGTSAFASYSLVTNSPPSGGYLEILGGVTSVTALDDEITIVASLWSDDTEDMPLTYSFGYVHGLSGVDGGGQVMPLSGKASNSNKWTGSLPPGLPIYANELSIVVTVRDQLNTMVISSTGADGNPVLVTSAINPATTSSDLISSLEGLDTAGLTVEPEAALGQLVAVAGVAQVLGEGQVEQDITTSLVASITTTSQRMDYSEEATGMLMSALSVATEGNGALPAQASTGALSLIDDLLEQGTGAGVRMRVSSASDGLNCLASIMASVDSAASRRSLAEGSDSASFEAADVSASVDRLAIAATADAIPAEAPLEISAGGISVAASVGRQEEANQLSAGVVKVNLSGEGDGAESVESEQVHMVLSALGDIDPLPHNSSVAQSVSLSMYESSSRAAVTSLTAPVQLCFPIATTDLDKVDCTYWDEVKKEWRGEGLVITGVTVDQATNEATICCTSNHLTIFSAESSEGIQPEWNTVNLIDDASLLAAYGDGEGTLVLVFLGLLCISFGGLFLKFRQAASREVEAQWLDHELHRIYLLKGHIPRARLPVDARTLQREKEWRDLHQLAHMDAKGKDFSNIDVAGEKSQGDAWLNSQYDFLEEMEQKVTMKEADEHHVPAKTVARTAAASIFFNHTWKELFSNSSRTLAEKQLSLPKHQMSVLLLCDLLYAMCLQAIFYGKNQFGIQDKAVMVLTSAVFMAPALLVYPRLFRWANCPPTSITLQQSWQRKVAMLHNETRISQRKAKLAALEGQQDWAEPGMSSPASPESSVRVKQMASRVIHVKQTDKAVHVPEDALDTQNRDESVYMDVQDTELWEELSNMHLALGTFLFTIIVATSMLTAVLVKQYVSQSDDSNTSFVAPNGLAPNLAISFSGSSCVMAVWLLLQLRGRHVKHIGFVRFWLCIFASGLAFTGIFLVESGGVTLTVAVSGTGTLHLVALYWLRIMLRHMKACDRLAVDFAELRYQHPTAGQIRAATCIQSCWRSYTACVRLVRARELHAWRHDCHIERRLLTGMAYTCLILNIILLLYCNLIFGIKFDRDTCLGWLLTCLLATIIEGVIQQPVVLLIVSIMGDFVEVLGQVLLEVLIG
ncbi:unnamed protein product [Chrysoparadoxa australica]